MNFGARRMKKVGLFCLLLLPSACQTDAPLMGEQFVWTQTENGLGMTAPIEHTIRIELSGEKLTVRTRLVDAVGRSDLRTDVRPCTVFDNKNFSCALIPEDTLSMKNGVLHHYYWGSKRIYRTQSVVLGQEM